MSPDELAGCTFDSPCAGWSVVHVTGELDASSTPPVEARILRHLDGGSPTVVLDLSGVTFIDSTGIRLIMQVLHRRKEQGITVVCPQSRAARKALEIIGLGRVVRFTETLEEALPRSS